MSESANYISAGVRRIHLIAICGTAMGALACALQQLGYQISGSDAKVYPPMSEQLAQKGICVHDGFAAENLTAEVDLVIVGNAVSRGNPEVEEMLTRKLAHCSMPQAINHFLVADKQAMLVTGTHGKTTTSALLAWVLQSAGVEPSFVIGGVLENFDSNYQIGSGADIVLEGDEYDTAFFDKGPKFLHYDPVLTILTSVEFDHADIFHNVDHVHRVFTRLLSRLHPQSILVACVDDPQVKGLLKQAPCRLQTYGQDSAAMWRATDLQLNASETRFTVLYQGRPFGDFHSPMLGHHNLANTLAVIAAAHHRGLNARQIAAGLNTFKGIKRRQQERGRVAGIRVIDDFAHHPTAVRETIKAMQPHRRSGRLIAVFEPRTNTSMRHVFQDVYPQSFDGADLVCIRQPSMLEKVPADQRFSSRQLVQDLMQRGLDAHFFDDTDEIIAFLLRSARSGDVVLVMSNGGFDNIHEKLLKSLKKRYD